MFAHPASGEDVDKVSEDVQLVFKTDPAHYTFKMGYFNGIVKKIDGETVAGNPNIDSRNEKEQTLTDIAKKYSLKIMEIHFK